MNIHDFKIAGPAESALCKICSSPSPLYGVVDFSKNCERGLTLPQSGVLVGYNRCPACGFLFTPAFDAWGHDEYGQAIYNDDYILVDPDYKQRRPEMNAALLTNMFAADKGSLSVLDYGGGNGLLADTLARNGFQSAATYDPFNSAFATLPDRRFNVVSCFETLEHVPDPLAQIAAIAKCVDDKGVVIFSTLVQSPDFDRQGLDWWYVGPRNGHISLFSTEALARAWRVQGFNFGSFNGSLHLACRELPAFARHLMRPA